jgi:methyl-accepting chemotaxis protein/methyl-accepting chemotaxis protein-1 (serine sensor receptor)
MKVSTKLYGAVGTLALTGLLVSGTGIWYLRTLGEELRVATGETALKLDLVNAARARSWEMVAALRGVYLFASLNNAAELDSNARRWDAAFKRTRQQIAELRPLMVTEEGKTNLAKFESGLSELENASAGYVSLAREHKFDQLADVLPRVEAFAKLADETLNSLKDQQRNLLKDSRTRAGSLGAQSLLAAISLSCLLLGIVVMAVLEVRAIVGTLAAAASELSGSAEEVAAAARQVSSSSQSLARSSSEHAASLQQTSASSEEIDSVVRKNRENSRGAADLMAHSQQNFAQTNESLEKMVVAMSEIDAHSDKISKIIRVIDEIAFQTNILALNAAVEAARAGEAGMGFAVVADEVRNLAQRCASAAKDTSALIEESIAKSKGGKLTVEQMSGAIRAITGESAQVKTLVDEVNLGSQEQARGIDQIAKTISQMERITQQTASSAEESASAADELYGQSERLKAVVKRLTNMLDGDEVAQIRAPS